MTSLQGLRVMIAEDEYFLADEMARRFEAEGATVLGPWPTIEQALSQLCGTQALQAAVLDIYLKGELVFPLADELARREVPFVFVSGYDGIRLPPRFEHVQRVGKPTDWRYVVKALQLQQQQAGLLPAGLLPPRAGAGSPELWAEYPGCAAEGAQKGEVVALLPQLLFSARLLLGAGEAAERLVERTLRRALVELPGCAFGDSLEERLHALLQRTLAEERPSRPH